jgi:hypothetical protein
MSLTKEHLLIEIANAQRGAHPETVEQIVGRYWDTLTAERDAARGEALREAARLVAKRSVENYPGPHTIITDPNWHAPKIFRAAERALESLIDAEAEKRAKEREAEVIPVLKRAAAMLAMLADRAPAVRKTIDDFADDVNELRVRLEANRLAALPASGQVGFCALCPSCGGCTQGHVHCTKCGCPKQGGQAEGKEK